MQQSPAPFHTLKIGLSIFVFLLGFNLNGLSQSNLIDLGDFGFCGTSEVDEEFLEKNPLVGGISSCSQTTDRGRYLPSSDTLRVRVVFAKFQDDTKNVPYWPSGGFPSFALGFIDSTASQNSTHKHNLTHYYRTFSDGQFIMIGKVDTLTFSQSMYNSIYSGSPFYAVNTYNANKDVLAQLSSQPGFQLYDDWTKANQNHSKCSDGRADHIIMIWRANEFGGNDVGGFASMGSGTNYTIDGKQVVTGFSATGSGVSIMRASGEETTDALFNITIHEIGHYFLGGNHPHIQAGGFQHRGRHFFPSMMGESKEKTLIPNPLERDYLKWITPITLTSNTTVTIPDYVTGHVAYKWSNTGSNDLFYFFNSQRLNTIYDAFTENANDKGIFIMHHRYVSPDSYHQSDANAYNNKLISSEGDYDWEHVNPYFAPQDHSRRVYRRTKPNPVYGRSHLTMIQRGDPCEVNPNEVFWVGSIGNTESAVYYSYFYCNEPTEPAAIPDMNYNYLGHGFISSFSYENNRAYWSSITNPMAKQYQAWDATTATALPISMYTAPTGMGGSINVTFTFNQDPFYIDANRVWSGEIFIPDGQNVQVRNGATLTILPDTRIFFGKNNARISVSNGGKIMAIGTQNKPITFTTMYPTDSWNPSNEWGQIQLASSGNRFEWTIFEYGTKHIEVASRDNIIKNSIFRKGWRGISSYSNQSGSGGFNSEVRLEQVLLADNRGSGFAGYFNDSYIHDVTISGNGEAGVWYSGSNGLSFHSNLVEENVQILSGYYGVEVLTNSSVFLLEYYGHYGEGRNVIRDQPDSQILVMGSGAFLDMGSYYSSNVGYGSITGGSSHLVINTTGNTISAHENWWGGHPVSSSWFDGPVDYALAFSADPGLNAGASQLPVESHLYVDQYLRQRPSGGGHNTVDQAAFVSRLQDEAGELRARLRTGDSGFDTQDIRGFAHVTALMWDTEHFSVDQQKNELLIEELYELIRQRVANESGSISFSLNEQLIVELFMKHTFGKNPERAYSFALPLLTRSRSSHVELAARWTAFYYTEQTGQAEEALTHLNRIVELERGHGVDEALLAGVYEKHRDIVLNRPGLADSRNLNKGTDNDNHEDYNQAGSQLSVSIYPNPFNPVALLQINITEESQVYIGVYNILGQKVATLANETFQTGGHTLRLDGTNLASGVYIIRSHIGSDISIHRVTLLK